MQSNQLNIMLLTFDDLGLFDQTNMQHVTKYCANVNNNFAMFIYAVIKSVYNTVTKKYIVGKSKKLALLDIRFDDTKNGIIANKQFKKNEIIGFASDFSWFINDFAFDHNVFKKFCYNNTPFQVEYVFKNFFGQRYDALDEKITDNFPKTNEEFRIVLKKALDNYFILYNIKLNTNVRILKICGVEFVQCIKDINVGEELSRLYGYEYWLTYIINMITNENIIEYDVDKNAVEINDLKLKECVIFFDPKNIGDIYTIHTLCDLLSRKTKFMNNKTEFTNNKTEFMNNKTEFMKLLT